MISLDWVRPPPFVCPRDARERRASYVYSLDNQMKSNYLAFATLTCVHTAVACGRRIISNQQTLHLVQLVAQEPRLYF